MVAACDTATIQDLVRHGTVQSPSGAGVSGVVTSVRPGGGPANVPGDVTGWVAKSHSAHLRALPNATG
jgi:hypothetical protein